MNFLIVYPKDIAGLEKDKGAVVVDLRPRKSFELQHWEHALQIEEQEVENYRKYMDQNRLYIFYCEHGGSSMQIARNLGRQGYQTASVVGGYEAMKKFEESYFKK